ncbi:MAG: helicase-associated domain-containing protein [Fimbriiglobus sp.]|jgi:hypothetical protein|nr:helicase-associated domain-containing protein [Fimbriiglobus sp.]
MPTDAEQLIEFVRAALEGYAEPLRKQVAAGLLRSRNPIPPDELTERLLATLSNPPVVDRRLKDLSAAARRLLALLGLTRRTRWKIGHLLTTLAAVGHAEGITPVREVFDAGLLFPVRPEGSPLLDTFESWLGMSGVEQAEVFTHPLVSVRARVEKFDLPDLGEANARTSSGQADGLEWLLRIAGVVQLTGETPFRRTQAGALFKRDLTRLQTSDLLSAATADFRPAAPDLGVLATCWAIESGALVAAGDEWRLAPPADPPGSLYAALTSLVGGLFGVEHWDPLHGGITPVTGLSSLPSATAAVLLLLANAGGWVPAERIAEWLWAHHPSWSGVLPKEAHGNRGVGWVETLLAAVLFPLRLVEVCTEGGFSARLTDLGQHLFADGPKPADPPDFPQTLLVQPNAEVVAYRQGLTPGLIASLTRFAKWKGFGAACMLELTPEQTYRGLEGGLTLAEMVQVLNRHGSRPVPPAVADLLQRWANKRERIVVYAAATVVEFATPADLDAALARGLVAVRVTDRLGLCPNGADPDFKYLRLIGNREYDARPVRCVTVGDDGVTLGVDATQSDLLLEPELTKLADPSADGAGPRRWTVGPASVRRAMQTGLTAPDLEAWFVARTGGPMPPAVRLFVQAPALPPSLASRRLVMQLPTEAAADGVMRWAITRKLVDDRLGPTAIVIDEANLRGLVEVLAEIGLRVEMDGVGG